MEILLGLTWSFLVGWYVGRRSKYRERSVWFECGFRAGIEAAERHANVAGITLPPGAITIPDVSSSLAPDAKSD